MLKKIQEY